MNTGSMQHRLPFLNNSNPLSIPGDPEAQSTGFKFTPSKRRLSTSHLPILEPSPVTQFPQFTVKPRLTATSVIPSPHYYGHFFNRLAKRPEIFLEKKNLLIRSPVNAANFFGPIGDRIDGVPLCLLTSHPFHFYGPLPLSLARFRDTRISSIFVSSANKSWVLKKQGKCH